MRHLKKTAKFGRSPSHREALLVSLVCNLIMARRIRTTVQKAKAARGVAEKMVTMAKKGTLAARRLAVSRLHQQEPVKILFESIAPEFADRAGGYTRIVRLGRRSSDSSEMAILEWVNYIPVAPKKKEKDSAGKSAEPAKDSKEAAAKKPERKKTVKKKAVAAE